MCKLYILVKWKRGITKIYQWIHLYVDWLKGFGYSEHYRNKVKDLLSMQKVLKLGNFRITSWNFGKNDRPCTFFRFETNMSTSFHENVRSKFRRYFNFRLFYIGLQLVVELCFNESIGWQFCHEIGLLYSCWLSA